MTVTWLVWLSHSCTLCSIACSTSSREYDCHMTCMTVTFLYIMFNSLQYEFQRVHLERENYHSLSQNSWWCTVWYLVYLDWCELSFIVSEQYWSTQSLYWYVLVSHCDWYARLKARFALIGRPSYLATRRRTVSLVEKMLLKLQVEILTTLTWLCLLPLSRHSQHQNPIKKR